MFLYYVILCMFLLFLLLVLTTFSMYYFSVLNHFSMSFGRGFAVFWWERFYFSLICACCWVLCVLTGTFCCCQCFFWFLSFASVTYFALFSDF